MVDAESLLREELDAWPATSVGAAILSGREVLAACGPPEAYPWASVTKLMTALAVLDAAEEGRLDLEEPAGPPGSTVRHLLAHASGLSADSDRVLAKPGVRRIYSNRGFDILGDLLEREDGASFSAVLQRRVLDPLGMRQTTCDGSAAYGARGPVSDLAILAAELVEPRHFPRERIAAATSTAFPGLSGVLPGFGRQEPNDWGLGFEIRSTKNPHWMSPQNSPLSFGHFGQAGSFLWVDPVAGLACVTAGSEPFGPWAATAWPQLSSRVLALEAPSGPPESTAPRQET